MTDDMFQTLLDEDAEPFELDVAAVEAAQEIKALRTALAELVALHDICVTLPAWPMSPDPDKDKRADFDRRQPLARVAARRVLGLAT